MMIHTAIGRFAPGSKSFVVGVAPALALFACAGHADPPATTGSSAALSGGSSAPAVAAESEQGWHAPAASAPGVSSNCKPWATHVEGAYRYENNQWGSDKSKAKFEQCLLQRSLNGKTEQGWSWNWPGFDPSVFAYPEIEFGWKPWSGGKPSDARFPLRVSEVKHLVMNYEVETDASGSYDLAPEIWLTKSGKWSSEPNAKLITTEVMFWMDYAAGARPAGAVVETPTLDGVRYELWKEDKIGEAANGQGWRLLSFKSPEVRRAGKISIHALLQHLVEKKLVDAGDYVASIEFGNEVMGGTGTTWVKRFDLEIGD